MKNVSFVFQGSVTKNDKIDPEVIYNISKVAATFPNSDIIVSTWDMDIACKKNLAKMLEVNNIKIIYSNDPGALIFFDLGVKWITNINRMIVSTLMGIKECSTTYVVKLRTDSYFYNRNLEKIFNKINIINSRFRREDEFSFFSERVINCNLFARHSRLYRPFLFHPGDIMLFGLKTDLMDLFDIPLAGNTIFELIIKKNLFTLMNLVPEQYLWVTYLNKKKDHLFFKGNKYQDKNSRYLSEVLYVNNFIPLNCEQLGFLWPKHKAKYRGKGVDSIYQFKDWVYLNSSLNKNNKFLIDNNKITKKVKLHSMVKGTILSMIYQALKIPLLRKIAMNLNRRY